MPIPHRNRPATSHRVSPKNIPFDNASVAAQKGFGIAIIIAHDHAQDIRQTQPAAIDQFGRALEFGL